MNPLHYNEVNNISECNLLHNILNPSKRTKNIISNYYPILRVCMNTQKGKAKFNNFRILLDSGCSSNIVIRRLIKTQTKEDFVIQWNTQLGDITTNLKVKIDLTLSEFRPAKMLTWDFHVDDCTQVSYDMILGRDLLKLLGLNIYIYFLSTQLKQMMDR